MGITWRFTMPLLSTLAALVIIVNSAEEDLDRDYRYDLRPKALDTRSSSYEQPWKVAEPMMQQSELSESWYHEQDELPVRRRLGRKRKRRPPADLAIDDFQDTKYSTVQEAPTSDHYDYDVHVQETTELPRRRRKKLNLMPNRWTDEPISSDVPIRRRLQRRKRPSLDTWPALSEFGGFERDSEQENNREVIKSDALNENRGMGDLIYREHEDDNEYDDKEINIYRPKVKYTVADNRKESAKQLAKEDKSLSEFSLEVMSPMKRENDDINAYVPQTETKVRDKSSKVFYELDKAQEKALHLQFDKFFDFKSEYVSYQNQRNKKKIFDTLKDLMEEIKCFHKYNDSVYQTNIFDENNKHILLYNKSDKLKDKMGTKTEKVNFLEQAKHLLFEEEDNRDNGPINPQTLKDILKRSNGTSLSEILQQHNLTLGDLLSKKENALTLLQTLNRSKSAEENITRPQYNLSKQVGNGIIERPPVNSEDNHVIKLDKNSNVFIQNSTEIRNKSLSNESGKNSINEFDHSNQNYDNILQKNNLTQNIENDLRIESSTPKVESKSTVSLVRHRFPGSIRRKLRMRPTLNNNNYKGQLSRDIVALSPRKYVHHNRRNLTKAKEWKDMIPLMPKLNTTNTVKERDEESTTVTTSEPEETTTLADENEAITTVMFENTVVNYVENDTNTDIPETTSIPIEIVDTELYFSVTEQPIFIPSLRPEVNKSGSRRQALNNRLKRKRLKHKTSTTKAPPDDIMKNILHLGDFVSSSEFIARTQLPKFTNTDDYRDTTTDLEDFITTEPIKLNYNEFKTEKPYSHKSLSKPLIASKYPYAVTTEETAKIEIQEILNDTRTSSKLSNILRERNMTLRELLDHRERGSSHVHLADIFHNASREPNPPEPFLSKSLLEPISKETYPLRALLDANSHDANTKATTIEPNALLINHVNIPVIMDFGNNVNENADNMGIISLFNNITKDGELTETITLQQDSDGKPYQSTIINVNVTNDGNDARESRMLDVDDQEDLVNWNEIFSMIRKNNKNETASLGTLLEETENKIISKEDIDGAGSIVLEDLQHLRDLDSIAAPNSEENIEFNSFESDSREHSVLSKASSSTKSVTIATASIVGLAMVLFLLTYAAIKWKQQRALNQKSGFREERIPSPVFENRKVKKNCSNRSISPMLASSNIYTMSTLDSQNGKDSPEYMWDTLRKPFQ